MIHLLFSANRWEAAGQIRALIEEGITVVIDRYYYSGIVYSAAKGRPDLTLEWARQPEIGLPRPDVCLFLDITPEAAVKRKGYGGEKYETDVMQTKVRELFHELIRLHPDGRDMKVIDAGRELEEVERDITMTIQSAMSESKLQESLPSILPLKDLDGEKG